MEPLCPIIVFWSRNARYIQSKNLEYKPYMLTCVSYLYTLYISFLYMCRTVKVDTDQNLITLLKIIQFMTILMNYMYNIKIIFAKTSCLIFAACCLCSQSMEPYQFCMKVKIHNSYTKTSNTHSSVNNRKSSERVSSVEWIFHTLYLMLKCIGTWRDKHNSNIATLLQRLNHNRCCFGITQSAVTQWWLMLRKPSIGL